MKPIYLVILFFISCSTAFGQNSLDPTKAYDFWIGQWNLTWKMADGNTGKGVNHIHYTLDDKVIQENFEVTDAGQYTGFAGKSFSVWSPQDSTWHQTWVDNQGGYYDLTGEVDGENRILKAKPNTRKDGKVVAQRMVFHDIQPDSFIWDWEASQDGGKTWQIQWRINYQRNKQ